MIIGAKGNRYDLLLQALLFRDGRTDDVPYELVDDLEDDLAFDARAIPLHTRHTTQGAPIVGTDVEAYFAFRGLTLARGEVPGLMGQAVLGHRAAVRLGLSPGESLTADRVNLYNLARMMPLQLDVVGVLDPANNADDDAVFVGLKTAWIIAGLGHGHNPEAHQSEATHAATVTAIRITPDNADSFHFHGEDDELPLSAVLVLPKTQKDHTLITTRYNAGQRYQALHPARVMDELMGLVLRIKRLFDASTALVAAGVLLLIGLVIALSMKLREAERRTLHKLGCGRWLIVQVQVVELAIVFAGALFLAGLGSLGVLWVSPWVLGL